MLGLALLVFAVLLHALFASALWRQFDARLAEDARAVAGMVEERGQGPWEFERGALGGEFEASGRAYYEVWMDDGSVLARSASLGARDLDRRAPGESVVLPDGRNGRSWTESHAPRWDEEGPPRPSGRRVTVTVARATQEIESTLATLRLLLGGSGVTALAVAALAAAFTVRRGLRPAARLAARIDAIDARRLSERLPTGGLPQELAPAVRKLNDLLARLEAAFERERQFGADVSHELRTPLAGLRAVLEVAASRDRTAAEYRAAIDEALVVVTQMSGLVDRLLLLARLDARQATPTREEVGLHDLADECLRGLAPAARARRLRLANQVPEDAVVESDREMLRMIVANLVGNAVDYTEEGGWVSVGTDLPGGVVVVVRDSGPAIPEGLQERIFDRFFRLDAARNGAGEHGGIGLALVRALGDALALGVTAENRPDGSVAFVVSGPARLRAMG